jgi:hypothetical protein
MKDARDIGVVVSSARWWWRAVARAGRWSRVVFGRLADF